MDDLNEVSPKGWGGTTSAMKKHHKDIDNPWALAYWMKKRDFKSHYKNDPKGTKSKKEPVKKDESKKSKFKEWLELRETQEQGQSKEQLTQAQKDNIKELVKIKHPHGNPKPAIDFLKTLKNKMHA